MFIFIEKSKTDQKRKGHTVVLGRAKIISLNVGLLIYLMLSIIDIVIGCFGFGVFAGVMSYLVLKFLYSEQGSTIIEPSDYVGLIGRISVPIPEDRLGQVMLDVKMQKKRMPARSEGGGPIAVNTQVEIVSAEGGVLIVRTFT